MNDPGILDGYPDDDEPIDPLADNVLELSGIIVGAMRSFLDDSSQITITFPSGSHRHELEFHCKGLCMPAIEDHDAPPVVRILVVLPDGWSAR